MTGKAKTEIGLLTQGGAGQAKRPPPGRGRQTKLTPEVSKKICDAVRAGNFISVAARYAGVGPETVMDWQARGRGTHRSRRQLKVFVDFVHDLDAAEAAAEVQANIHWRAAMPKDWKASQKWLEVRYPERYARQDAQNGPQGAFAGVNVNIGVGGQQTDANGQFEPYSVHQAPLSELLEANPSLIASTMQVLDQFLPIDGNVQPGDANGVIEAEFAEVGSTETQFPVSGGDLQPDDADEDE